VTTFPWQRSPRSSFNHDISLGWFRYSPRKFVRWTRSLISLIEDLYVIVSTATKSVESDMKKFYSDLLEKSGWKSPVPKDDTGKVPTKAPRASGAGQSASMATNGGPGASAVMNAAAVAGKAVTAGA
jgi:hypothetical protein